MSMRLWTVRISWDLVVRAEDASAARIAAMDAVQEPLFDDEPTLTMPTPVSAVRDLPSLWDGTCRPYGERDEFDRTIAEQLSENAPRDGSTDTVGADVGRDRSKTQ